MMTSFLDACIFINIFFDYFCLEPRFCDAKTYLYFPIHYANCSLLPSWDWKITWMAVPLASSCLQMSTLGLTYLPIVSPGQWTALSSNRVECSVWELNFLTMDFLNPCCFSSIGYLVHYILCNFVYWCLGVNNCILMRKNDLNYSSNIASYGMQC